MARKKITELPLDNAVIGTDVVPIVSDGATKRVQLSTLGTYFATIGGGQPDAHAATHSAAGSDPITVSASQISGGALPANASLDFSDGTSDSEIGGWGFGVELTEDGSVYATVEPSAVTVHGASGYAALQQQAVYFSNGTSLAVGTFDSGRAGYNGLSLVCAVGYELNWQAGYLKCLNVNGTTRTIACESPIEFPGEGTANVTIDATGVTFSDGSQQTAAWGGSVAIADVTGLQDALDSKQAAGSYAASSHAHVAADITDFTSAVVAAAPAAVYVYDSTLQSIKPISPPQNVASGYRSVVAGGAQNSATARSAVVSGGEVNSADYRCVVGGGGGNVASGFSSSILGGTSNNTNNKSNAHIVGGGITADADNTAFVNALKVMDAGRGITWQDGTTQTTAFTGSASALTSGTLPDARLSSNIARTSDVTSAVAAVVGAAPASLDTLKELADALGSDANFASTVTNSLAGKVGTSDSRLTDAREWSASTVSQADAEAGTSTTRAAFTPLRVFQAIAAWWAGSAAKTKLDGIATGATANATDAQLRDRSTHTGTQAWSTITSTPTSLSGYGITDGVTTSDSRLTDARTPTSHAHGNITNAGAIGSTSGQIVVTTTSGVLTTAATIAASTQVSGLGSLATLTPTGTADNTTYLRGDGAWATVTAGVSSVNGATGAVTVQKTITSGTAAPTGGANGDIYLQYT